MEVQIPNERLFQRVELLFNRCHDAHPQYKKGEAISRDFEVLDRGRRNEA
jgi:hypothetical protein